MATQGSTGGYTQSDEHAWWLDRERKAAGIAGPSSSSTPGELVQQDGLPMSGLVGIASGIQTPSGHHMALTTT